MSAAPKLCLTLTAPTLAEDARLACQYAPLADLAELRADCLDAAELGGVADFPLRVPMPCVLTVRRVSDGGKFAGGEDRREALFAALRRFAFVDFESDFRPAAALRLAREAGVRVIRSRHVLSGCGGEIAATADALAQGPGEIPKIAFRPRSLSDVTALFRTARALPPRDRILCATGPLGAPSRILAGRTHSLLSYASPPELLANTAAVGHLDPVRLEEVYAFRSISPATRLCGVTGWPLAVTSSPEVHRALCRREGLDAVLVPLPAEDATQAIAFAEEVGMRGLAVTTPHKEGVLGLLDALDDDARAIGAANTVVWRDGRRLGFNTDAAGFARAVSDFLGRPRLDGMRVAILGAGGAARAVAFAVRRLGGEGCVFARRVERARAVAQPHGFGAAALPDLSPSWRPSLLVQCTPVGLGAADPAADPIPHYAFSGGEALYDLVYQPETTPLMARARAAGCRAENGLSMLQAQAEAQHRLFHH